MSLPLTRRIARAALLVGAAAAPLVEGVAKGTKTVTSLQKALPDPGKTLTGAAKTAAPLAQKTATDTAGAVKGAAGGLGGTAKGAEGAGPLKGLPISQLPVSQLPIANAGLPIGG
jgi:hypothetical protein